MKKRWHRYLLGGLICKMFLSLTGCGSAVDQFSEGGPFSNNTAKRDLIVIMSDMHLGADLIYAECNKNREALADILQQVKDSKSVKELVIAGDLIDEWFVPANVETYKGKDQSNFVQRLAETNKGVFDALNNIIQEEKILVTYVPGNHDLAITKESIEQILPGIKQARDKDLLGLGTYYPVNHPEIAIEHGHRYNFFCSPDRISNQDIAPGTIMPPGYFFTRIAALSVVEGMVNKPGKKLELDPPATNDISQKLLFGYWKLWKWTIEFFTINEGLDDKIIQTNQNGFTKKYSINDLLPYNTAEGTIDVELFKGIQDTWNERQKLNNVPVYIPADHAIAKANDADETDNLAITQYFKNPDSDARIVVFGHNHRDTIIPSENLKGEKTIYANAGTWIDHNPMGPTATFVVIAPQDNTDTTTQTCVKVYIFENEIIAEKHSDSVRL